MRVSGSKIAFVTLLWVSTVLMIYASYKMYETYNVPWEIVLVGGVAVVVWSVCVFTVMDGRL